MNENINPVEILKDAPKGTKLWSHLCGECILDDIDTSMTSVAHICVEVKGNEKYHDSNYYYITMNKDMTYGILLKAKIHKNPKAFSYQIEGLSNFNTESFSKYRDISTLYRCYKVNKYH